MKEVEQFLAEWTEDEMGVKPVFLFLMDELSKKPNIELEFVARPGVSYSLRGIPRAQTEKPLFVMIDVIDDNPEQRWLSVCFYGEMITDPEELGDLIPEGLLGSDGYCFDMTDADDHNQQYVARRVQEAYEAAFGGD
jgi:hypothetical protein